MNSTEYKKYHESFMQNNSGSTAVHTFFCIFFTVQCALLCANKQRSYDSTKYVAEYFIIVLPTILAHTVLSRYIYELNLCVCILLLYEVIKKIESHDFHDALKAKNNFENHKIQSITCLRGLTYLITVICILAVDFKDFPRYLAKTEKYGYSLMDTGVGLFILMSGLVHKDITKNNYKSVLKGNAKFILILVILGVTRYLSVKHLDYQNHITEYGVHWNFFYTLAVCKFLSSFLLCLSSQSLLLSIVTIGIHEFLLYSGWELWVFSDTLRIGFIDANKEGITSSLGYIALYLVAAHIKKELINKSAIRYDILRKLLISSLVFMFCSYIVNAYKPISRTLANAGYYTYLCSTLLFILTIMYFLEITYFNKGQTGFAVPSILVAINYNGLFFFLVANMATGLINMSFRTLFLSTFTTFLILNLYMIFTISLTVYIEKKGFKL